MIEQAQIGMMVVVVPSECGCDGHDTGTVGYVTMIEENDQFLVKDRNTEDYFWHCRECVTKLK